MGKGKNFDAAEKHFEKKRLEYTRRIKELETTNILLVSENNSLLEQTVILTDRNLKLEAENRLLLELKDISQQDLDLLLVNARQNKSLVELFSVFSSLPSMS